MLGKLARDESGMTMVLVLITIVLIGVMGAGLLTFVSRDLNTVVEVNQGQEAFDLADAGIEAARQQLDAQPLESLYSGDSADDSNWSYQKNGGMGMTLSYPGVPGEVSVAIKWDPTGSYYQVISTSTADDAQRKIEARYKKSGGGGGGGNDPSIPVYYTPSDIKIKSSGTRGVSLRGMSLFAEGNILIQNLTTPASFRADYEDNGGALQVQSTRDELRDWNSTNSAVYDPAGNWNTIGRKDFYHTPNPNRAFERAGLAAEGKICGFLLSSTGTCPSTASSVADGVYGYDSTTGPTGPTGSPNLTPRGNRLTFVDKPNNADGTVPPNQAGTITYPFPRPTPNPAGLKQRAQDNGTYYKGSSPPLNTLFPNASGGDRVVFIDAEGGTIDFSTSNSANNKGVLVVWCGNLVMNQNFQGIVLNLYGDDLPGGSSCGADKGVYRNAGQDFSGWVYAEGGTTSTAGIELDPGSSISPLPAGDWDLLDLAFGTTAGPIQLQTWRECTNNTAGQCT